MHPTTTSYENRVRDIQSYLRQLRDVTEAIDTAKFSLEEVRDRCVSSLMQDKLDHIDSAERDAVEFIRELYETERLKLFKLLKPIDS